MTDLPDYDNWKTTNPDDDICEFCGADPRLWLDMWRPSECTGKCGRAFRDADAEYDAWRDDRDYASEFDDWQDK